MTFFPICSQTQALEVLAACGEEVYAQVERDLSMGFDLKVLCVSNKSGTFRSIQIIEKIPKGRPSNQLQAVKAVVASQSPVLAIAASCKIEFADGRVEDFKSLEEKGLYVGLVQTESGSMTGEGTLQAFSSVASYFERFCVKQGWKKEGDPPLAKFIHLMIDGAAFHKTAKTQEGLKDMFLSINFPPANSTAFLQVHDVSIFGKLKRIFAELCVSSPSGTANINAIRANAFTNFILAHEETVTPERLAGGFKRCGLTTFDTNDVKFPKTWGGDEQAPIRSWNKAGHVALTNAVETLFGLCGVTSGVRALLLPAKVLPTKAGKKRGRPVPVSEGQGDAAPAEAKRARVEPRSVPNTAALIEEHLDRSRSRVATSRSVEIFQGSAPAGTKDLHIVKSIVAAAQSGPAAAALTGGDLSVLLQSPAAESSIVSNGLERASAAQTPSIRFSSEKARTAAATSIAILPEQEQFRAGFALFTRCFAKIHTITYEKSRKKAEDNISRLFQHPKMPSAIREAFSQEMSAATFHQQRHNMASKKQRESKKAKEGSTSSKRGSSSKSSVSRRAMDIDESECDSIESEEEESLQYDSDEEVMASSSNSASQVPRRNHPSRIGSRRRYLDESSD